MSKGKEIEKIQKFSKKKCPPIICKKDVVQCMYCHYYDSTHKECFLYGHNYAIKRKPNDFCSYATLNEKWLNRLALSNEILEEHKSDSTQTEADILKELLK